ncbi:MAG TPA: glycosyl hydrolase family 28-related protein, partial [Pyrinomonadaceae bacterium]
MKFDKGSLQPRLAASIIVLIVLSGLVTSAKTVRPATTPSANETIISLADFNPVGDGVADDGPALQKALDALAENGGGTLFIPAGRYLIATPVAKDFSTLAGARITIQGVPSNTMPAPPDATGEELAASLDLASEIIPAVASQENALTLSNLEQVTIEHVAFTGREQAQTDAFVTIYLSDVDRATIRHCEFYGISTFGLKPNFGGGNVIRAVRSNMSIEFSSFLGCTANSGAYAPIVENIEWRGFNISNSIFIDYGTRSFYGKMGLGAPLSWINIANAAATTPDSPRREVVIRDIFLDEGGWVGITAFPRNWGPATAPIDLIYISGLKMNVSNLGTAGHLFYDARNLLIENSHYGWSHNTIAAVHIDRFEHAILDRLTCIADADRIRADAGTAQLTVINSNFGGIDSEALSTRVIETSPEDDPVQYVRQQFVSMLGRPPDPAAHFYWSERLLECEDD